MDDDEEIPSDPSRATPSPTPSPRRATANETYSSTPPSSQPLPPRKLTPPSQHLQQRPTGSGGGGSGGREDCWSEGATAVLIDAWGERYLELSRGNLKQKHWSEVAEVVSSREGYTKTPKTDVQCKNRIDTVKKKYKIEKAKVADGGGPSSWVFFDRLDRLIGQTSKYANSKSPVALPAQNPDPNPKVSISSGLKLQNPDVKGSKARKRSSIDSESDPDNLDGDNNDLDDDDDDSIDSLPPKVSGRKKAKVYKEVKNLGRKIGVSSRSGLASGSSLRNSIRELTRAMLKFGEVYEKTENAKLQQIAEIEKQRMLFAKDMELQRTQFFMKTQLEISQVKRRDKGGGGSRNHRPNNGENNNSGSSD